MSKNKISWEETQHAKELKGAELISVIAKKLPEKPGVYRMIDHENNVLYVGKAKNLKKRVTSYAQGKGHGGNRTARMISLTDNMEFCVTKTEIEALLLEANLIKILKPHFNILLRDDKSFPYIFISNNNNETLAGIFKHRGRAKNKDKGEYYGPFASTSAVHRTLDAMQKIFRIRTCSDAYYKSRSRPCLQFQIKRCSAPCTKQIKKIEYDETIQQAKEFLEGKNSMLKAKYAKEMNNAAKNKEFEKASVFRDRINALAQIQAHQDINPKYLKEADVFAIHEENGKFCVQVFFYRNAQNWGNKAFFPKADKSFKINEVIAAFIAQFYDNKPIPKCILTSHKVSEGELIQKALCAKTERKIELTQPKRGQRRKIVEQAVVNAIDALKRKNAEQASEKKLMSELAQIFKLNEIPKRIEVYDNSHISGTNAVGAMIVADEEGFAKNQYRKFNFKSKETKQSDDYAMMKEMLERRFNRLVAEENQGNVWPDLVVIDGGAGQLSAVEKVMEKLKINEKINIIAVAKGKQRNAGREKFFVKGKKPFTLPERDPVLFYIQRLRDEAHRFAIGTHRAKRKKAMGQNPLDEIEGIGAKRKRALLNAFGSAKAVSDASVEDLKKVENVSNAMAKNIYDHFHKE